jgi:hypothetical protein
MHLSRQFDLFGDFFLNEQHALLDRNGVGTGSFTFPALAADREVQLREFQMRKGTAERRRHEAGSGKPLPRQAKKGGADHVAKTAVDASGKAIEQFLIGRREGNDAVFLVMTQKALHPPLFLRKRHLEEVDREIKPEIRPGDQFSHAKMKHIVASVMAFKLLKQAKISRPSFHELL